MILRKVKNLGINDRFYYPNENKNTVLSIRQNLYDVNDVLYNLEVDCAGQKIEMRLFGDDMVSLVEV
jgi:hypothetical protein